MIGGAFHAAGFYIHHFEYGLGNGTFSAAALTRQPQYLSGFYIKAYAL